MSCSRGFRTRWFYRLALALPTATLVVGAMRMHTTPHAGPLIHLHHSGVANLLATLVTVVTWAPLAYSCWDLGRVNVSARRMGMWGLAGLGYVVRHAFSREPAVLATGDGEVTASPAPVDSVRSALLWAAPIAVMVPAFFEFFVPALRVPLAFVWVCGAGVFMASNVYFRRRAIAYLLDEPSPVAFFSGLRRLETSRYAEPGRRFVRLQLLSVWLLMIWWLGVGSLVLPHLGRAKP